MQDFTDVPLATCIERDRQRPASVGEGVIRTMHRQFLAGPVEPLEPLQPVKSLEPVQPVAPIRSYPDHPPASS
jgi:predicted kinase